jgi:phosphopantetheinyl transferase
MAWEKPIFEAWIAEAPKQQPDLLADILSEDERARGRQFHRQTLREQHVVAHALKRLCIAKWLDGQDPRELRFVTQASGKPMLLDAPLDFNISHSGGVCAVVLSSQGPCGVDIETHDAGRYLSSALLKTMTEKEQEHILAANDFYAAFVERWVVKEAYAKLTSLGLAERFDKLCTEQAFDGGETEFGTIRQSHVWRRRFTQSCIAVCVNDSGEGTWYGDIEATPDADLDGLTATRFRFSGSQDQACHSALAADR